MKTPFTKDGLISLSFLIIPLCFLITALIYIHSTGTIYLSGVDPEYAYLFNGMILANLHPDAYGVLHPGTPIQVLIAVVAWIVHMFRQGTSLSEDMMLHPEIYIRAAIITGNAINTFFLFLLGKMVFRYSHNYLVSLAMQVTPFAFLMTLEVSHRLMPEMIMTSLVSCWIIILVKLLYEAPEERNFKWYSMVFGFMFGLSFATKMTFLPYFILPFIILPTWKFRLRFTLVSILSFLIIAFPVWFNFPRYLQWVTSNFIHTGNYGTGDTGIINWNTFATSLNIMIYSTWQIIITAFVLLLIVLYSMKKNAKDIATTTGLGLLALFFLQYVITAKQYAFYYMTPSLLLCVFTGFLIFFLLMKLKGTEQFRRAKYGLLMAFVLILFLSVIPKMYRQVKELQYLKSMHLNASESLQPFLEKTPKIICPNYYRSSAQEYGLFFGICESGHHSQSFGSIFRKKYPQTIIYQSWSNTFYDANQAVTPSAFL